MILQRLLVVEDDNSVRNTIQTFLELEGYTVDAVASTREALERLRDDAYPIVISDIYVDERTGLDVLETARKKNPNCAVILMTARGTIETVLCSPVPRTDLVLGKFFMVLTASLSTGILAMISMGATFVAAKHMLAALIGKDNPLQFSIGLEAIFTVFLMVIPVAVLFSAGLLAIALFLVTASYTALHDRITGRRHLEAEQHQHEHGPNSGHPAIEHDRHVDYLHDGHRHAPHEGHYDEHDPLKTHDDPVRH